MAPFTGASSTSAMQYAFPLNKKRKPGKPKLVGQKVDLLFFHPASVKDIDTVGFIPGTGKEFLRGYAEVFTDAQKSVRLPDTYRVST